MVFQIADGCGFHKQMSRCEKLRENFAVRRASLQIQNNAALVGIGVYESQATFRIFNIAGEGRQQPVGVTTRRFDFDNVGAQVGEQARRVGRGNIPQFDDANVTEGPGIAVLLWSGHDLLSID